MIFRCYEQYRTQTENAQDITTKSKRNKEKEDKISKIVSKIWVTVRDKVSYNKQKKKKKLGAVRK